MNKELLISIKPEHLANILNGKKTLELRKTVPKDYKGWVNIYCTKGVGKTKHHHLYNLTEYNNGKTLFAITHHNKYSLVPDNFLNGKVVARFWFDEYDIYSYGDVGYPEFYEDYDGNIIDTTKDIKGYYVFNEELKKLCLSYEEFEEYGKEKDLYTWHIKQLEIFDKPKELSEFYKTDLPYVGIEEIKYALEINNTDNLKHYSLQKAPLNYQFVYVKELKE